MTNWDNFEKVQKEFCSKHKLDWICININLMIVINESIFTEIEPINGLRHNKTGTIEGWYLWSGGEIPQDEENFFKPIHLIERRPEVIKYLGLPVGYRFQIDRNEYEDIWFDENVAKV